MPRMKTDSAWRLDRQRRIYYPDKKVAPDASYTYVGTLGMPHSVVALDEKGKAVGFVFVEEVTGVADDRVTALVDHPQLDPEDRELLREFLATRRNPAERSRRIVNPFG